MSEKRSPAFLQYRPTFCLCLFFLLALLFTLRLSTAVNLVLTAVFCVLSLVSFLIERHSKLPLKLPALAILCTIASLLALFYHYPGTLLSQYQDCEEELPVTVRVEEITYEEGTLLYFNGFITELYGKQVKIKAKFYCYDDPPLSAGDVASAMATLQPLSSFGNATEDEQPLLANGFRAKVTLTGAVATDRFASVSLLLSRLREFLTTRLSSCLADESGALISGLLLGDTANISPLLVRNMNRLGISHLLAISGMHFTVLFLGLEKLLGRLGVNKRTRLALVAAFSFFYLALTGFSAAVMRAGFMLLLMILAFFLRVHYDTLTSLGVSLALICLFTPYAVYHAGLWLSAFATFGILALNERRRFSVRGERKRRNPLRPLAESLAVTMIAIVATSPLTSLLFGTFPLLSPVANLLLSPLMDLLLYLAPLLLFFPHFRPLVTLADGTVSLFAKITASLAKTDAVLSVSHPLIATMLLVTAIFILVYLCFTQQRIKLFIPATILLVGVLVTGTGYDLLALTERDTAEISFYSTDRPTDGEMFLLSSEGQHGVIDHSKGTSSFYRSFCAFAAERHIREFDFYVLSSYAQTANEHFLYLMESKMLREIYLPSPVTPQEHSLLTTFEERAEAADSKLVFYKGEESFSPCEITIRSLSVMENRRLSAAGFSITYGESEILFFSPTFHYISSHTFLLQKADAVFFGALGEQKETSAFVSPVYFKDVSFFCTDQSKTPFKNPTGCTVTTTRSFSLEKQGVFTQKSRS